MVIVLSSRGVLDQPIQYSKAALTCICTRQQHLHCFVLELLQVKFVFETLDQPIFVHRKLQFVRKIGNNAKGLFVQSFVLHDLVSEVYNALINLGAAIENENDGICSEVVFVPLASGVVVSSVVEELEGDGVVQNRHLVFQGSW